MKTEDLDRLEGVAKAANAFLQRYNFLTFARGWYEKERDGIVPEGFATEMQEYEAELRSAMEALK